jgi:hypothetical protein
LNKAARTRAGVHKAEDYNKTKDAPGITAKLDPLAMALNSRSFRRLLRCLGHPDYASQSARPARDAT